MFLIPFFDYIKVTKFLNKCNKTCYKIKYTNILENNTNCFIPWCVNSCENRSLQNRSLFSLVLRLISASLLENEVYYHFVTPALAAYSILCHDITSCVHQTVENTSLCDTCAFEFGYKPHKQIRCT